MLDMIDEYLIHIDTLASRTPRGHEVPKEDVLLAACIIFWKKVTNIIKLYFSFYYKWNERNPLELVYWYWLKI